MRTRKETSECEVRAVLIRTESTGGSGASCTAGKVCWGTTRSRFHTCEDGLCFSFAVGQGLLDYLLEGCIGLGSDGEDGPTNGRRLGMPRIVTVWSSHIDGEGTIVTESLDASLFTFHFCELAISPELATSVALGWLQSVGHHH